MVVDCVGSAESQPERGLTFGPVPAVHNMLPSDSFLNESYNPKACGFRIFGPPAVV